MRNHASPSHDSDDSVTQNDVLGLAIILKENLFDFQMPDPTYSPVSLIDPIKHTNLSESQVTLFNEQIDGFNNKDIRTIFGYALEVICSGIEPAYSNVLLLFQNIWIKSIDELKSNAGMMLHNYMFNPSSDSSNDKGAAERLYDVLLRNSGIKYVPDVNRAAIFRRLSKALATAKDTSYGWASENAASKALKQVGVCVPSIAFEEVYQEILSVWCGNYWGRSDAYSILHDFVFGVSNKQQIQIAQLFQTNERVKSELDQTRPKNNAVALVNEIKAGLTNQSQIADIDKTIQFLTNY